MATAFDNKDSKRTGIVLIIILLLIILILSFVFGGVEGIIGVLKFFIIFSLVVGFIGFIIYIIWFLFIKKNPRNIPAENWKSYMNAGLNNGSDMMDDLILIGDKHHSSKRFMTIKGYLRIKSFDGKEYDMFIGKRSSWSPFEEYKIVMLNPNQHSDLIGDVYVYGISLIMKFGFYFVNSEMLDFKAIDMHVASDTYRSLMFETLGDIKGLMDRATGLDSEWSKRQAENKLLKIPVLSGQQPQQPQQ